MKPLNGQVLIQEFEAWSPKSYAVEGDRNGLMIGTLNKPICKVMVALDVLEEVIDEAINEKVDLIVAHHPLLFRPLKKIDTDTPHGRIVEKAIKHDITIYAAHTNLDVAPGGVNDRMAEALGLKNIDVLAPTQSVDLIKLAVFVPESHEEDIRRALGEAGAGNIGDYSHCSYSSKGIGRFLPGDSTNPHIGERGKLEEVKEVKIETILPVTMKKRVLNAIIKAHPYEEPAYDIYPLDNTGNVLGLGRIGVLEKEISLEVFAEHVKQVFSVKGARVVGDLQTPIKKVAVLGGDGNKYINHAVFKGADVIVTGDVYYHVAHDAMMAGLSVVDPGHNVEKIMKESVKHFFENVIHEKKASTEVIASKIHTDPFQFV
ncbi:Nif3-like dinuclear metal center hexameric protein [Halalkalibacter sp. APA_J-10(15)]|uniref:Nif3-like dinuclear metal center hexameric protein n=1 Tax=Halalkalibacter sp. APA_J-10(15) TaxID=2933805 RepID=UPI001FF49A44|nr:Nif3-like dinuclear metal center hexameric protein [Halalkalibacter sp. APA_J-10(15)]MCK0471549.1 Nif3-like dinuclear metal center hexameric protein [Halalkalibacter sp. APA_J-10(15)]